MGGSRTYPDGSSNRYYHLPRAPRTKATAETTNAIPRRSPVIVLYPDFLTGFGCSKPRQKIWTKHQASIMSFNKRSRECDAPLERQPTSVGAIIQSAQIDPIHP